APRSLRSLGFLLAAFFFQAEDGIRDFHVTGVQTCALPILLRHGQTEWNAADRMQGQIDTDLTELGRRQAKEAARELVSRNAIAIVSSDLRRAHETALAFADHTDVPITVDPRLRETHLGEWQGLTH